MVSGILLCALLVCGPFAALAQDTTVTIIKNVQKTVTKTVNVVNGNGGYPGPTLALCLSLSLSPSLY